MNRRCKLFQGIFFVKFYNMVVYLDYNATTPYDAEVKSVIFSSITNSWANPSSIHQLGRKAKHIVDESRISVAEMINANPEDIIFTSGGTESNHLVIESAMSFFRNNHNCDQKNLKKFKPHIITSNIEHDSIALHLSTLVELDIADVTFVAVCKKTGQIQLPDIEKEIRSETCLVTVMMANNETGIIQPVWEIGNSIKESNLNRTNPILFHTDAAQAIGKIEVDLKTLNVDFLTIAGHKFYGPRIGALYVKELLKKPSKLQPLFHGGGQEKGFRPGTENVTMIAGLGKAAQLIYQNLNEYNCQMLEARDYLEEKLLLQFKDKIVFNNIRTVNITIKNNKKVLKEVPRLPNTVSVSFKGYDMTGAEILSKASQVCASTGAACHSEGKLSSVLLNCGVEPNTAKATLRLSVGRDTTKSEIDEAIEYINSALNC